MQLDQENGNTRWADAIALERKQIDEYNTFWDLGHKSQVKPPRGYNPLKVHYVFDVKHDGRHKARLVAGGHLTPIPIESVYSGVVSLRGFRIVLALGELNGMDVWSTDIGNAYLCANTEELLFVVAGPEFGELEGHILLVIKALYGLRTSGKRWNERFADCLRQEGFVQCKAEPEIWLRKSADGKVYEYIATYVDDLTLVLRDPKAFCEQVLEKKFGFKLKGSGPIKFHLGMDFIRDEDGVLCVQPRKYIEKLLNNYKLLFGNTPKSANVRTPLVEGDHPELDTSELLDSEGIQMYQSLIGSLQWVISIGRFDIHTAITTLSSFRVAPRIGHLDRIKRIYAYLHRMQHASIRICMDEPDYSQVPDQTYEWSNLYNDSKMEIPSDAPKPLGKFVTLTHYVDANLMHCMLTGRSMTGVLHLMNKFPVDWYAKKQGTVETATYGSEMVAARTCTEQILDLRLTLHYLGVPLRDKSFMFGDNKTVVDSSTNIDARLHKRHTMLSFHRVREAMATGMINFVHIPGPSNPADILSKHWGYHAVWPMLRSLLFARGAPAA